MSKVSIIIPARKEEFLRPTVEDILENATGDIEVIAVMDGYPDNYRMPNDSRLKMLVVGPDYHLRPAINLGISKASGEHLMKIDAHCGVGEGFDEILLAGCEEDWICVPSKYSLDPTNWNRFKTPWNYFYLTFPYDLSMDYPGLHDKNYGSHKNKERRKYPIDDIISYQGSCWFLSRKLWDRIGPMDHEHYYYAQEPQELGFKTWLSGGRVVVNKNTWYSHLHKGTAHRRTFPRYKTPWANAIAWSADYWLNNRWPDRVHDFKWLVEKFLPMPGWPEDWEDPKYRIAFEEKLNEHA